MPVSLTALQLTQGHGNRSTGENETKKEEKIGDQTANFIGHNNVGLAEQHWDNNIAKEEEEQSHRCVTSSSTTRR
jgi:hypothetical protein